MPSQGDVHSSVSFVSAFITQIDTKHAKVCSRISSILTWCDLIKQTVHKMVTSGFNYSTVQNGSELITPKENKPTAVNKPKHGVANRLIQQVGSSMLHPHHLHHHRTVEKGDGGGKEIRYESLKQNGNGPNELPGPTCEQLCTSTKHVHSSVSSASTFITQIDTKHA